MTIGKVIGRAWTDPAYKARLLSDSAAVLAEAGVKIPTGTRVEVVEDGIDIRHFVLPLPPPDAAELSAEDLEALAAGGAGGKGDM